MKRLRYSLSFLLLPGFATACELVAGIQDLQQGSTFDVPDSSTPRDSSASYGDGAGSSSSSSSSRLDAGADASGPQGDAIADAPSEGDAAIADGTVTDAPADAPLQDAGSGDADATAPIDATPDATADADAAPPPPVNTELIDDLESHSGHIIVTNGRTGSWFTYNDGTDGGVQSPLSPFLPSNGLPQLPNSTWAARTNGSGFTSFVGMGFTLNDPPSGPDAGVRSPYDAHTYTGVAFYARVASGTATHLRVNVPDVNTDAQGHICTVCADYFGAEITVTTTWTQYFASFSDMRSLNFGNPQPAALDLQAIYGVNFQFSNASNPAPVTFDLWVDNVSFITP